MCFACPLWWKSSDIIKIKEFENKSIKIIEDAATAGSKNGNRYVGSLNTDASVFSLYGNKVIISGEGGIISVRNSAIEKDKKNYFCAWTIVHLKGLITKKKIEIQCFNSRI